MSLKKLLSLKKFCFLHSINDSGVSLTPISQMVKQKIANQWIKHNVGLPSVEVIAQPLISYSDPITRNHFNVLKPIIEIYCNNYRLWTDSRLIGVIRKVTHLRDNKTKSFINSKKSDSLVLALFCPKKESLVWNQRLQGNHSHWFKNLTKSPLMSEFITKLDEKSKKWSLSQKIDDLEHQLETIEYLPQSSNPLLDTIDCDLILCQLDLDNSLLSFICDSFTQTNEVIKMKLNQSIAPFSIGFTFRDNNEVNEEMIETTNYMIDSLKQFEIQVFPFSANKLISIESYYEMGIPFVVIVDRMSPQNGVIAVRNRDTDIEQSVHLSDFQKTMCLILDVIHPSKIRNKF